MPGTPIGRQAMTELMPELHSALEHLISAWDHIRGVEEIVGFEITTEELGALAGGLDRPEDVRELVSHAIARDWLEDISDAFK